MNQTECGRSFFICAGNAAILVIIHAPFAFHIIVRCLYVQHRLLRDAMISFGGFLGLGEDYSQCPGQASNTYRFGRVEQPLRLTSPAQTTYRGAPSEKSGQR
jgi:hypothetical protein